MTSRNARTRWTSTVVLVVGMVLAGRGLLALVLWVTEDGPVTTTMTEPGVQPPHYLHTVRTRHPRSMLGRF